MGSTILNACRRPVHHVRTVSVRSTFVGQIRRGIRHNRLPGPAAPSRYFARRWIEYEFLMLFHVCNPQIDVPRYSYWRNYEAQLDDVKEILASVLEEHSQR